MHTDPQPRKLSSLQTGINCLTSSHSRSDDLLALLLACSEFRSGHPGVLDTSLTPINTDISPPGVKTEPWHLAQVALAIAGPQ
jgi:hypothetical protein